MPITRRELIKTGIGGVLLLNLVACAPERRDEEREMLRGIAAAMLAGALPSGGEYNSALQDAVDGVYVAIAGLPPPVQAEIAQLFALLRVPLTRAFVAGLYSSWSRASTRDVAAFLERWRTSNVRLFRTGYQALHQLVMGGWYGNERSWQTTGYPGPPQLT